MLKEELVEFVQITQRMRCEDGQTEIKSAEQGMPKIYDTLSAFSNQTGGGRILFGVDERKNYAVCGVYDADVLQRKISEICLQMEPVVRAVCTVAEIEDKLVVCAEIPEIEMSLRPCYYRAAGQMTGSYVRVGDSDCKMTAYEIYSYEAFRKQIHDELRPAPRAKFSDMQTPYLQNFLTKLAISKPRAAAQPINLLGLQTEDGVPTLAGTLLFSDYPQSFYPRLCLTAVVVPGETVGEVSADGARFIDNQTIEGTLHQMLEDAMKFVRRNMKNATRVNPNTGMRDDIPQYPLMAVREILLNALVHRDYSMHTESAPIALHMFSNRLAVENPGGLYGRLTLDSLGKITGDIRNPSIANAMEVMQDTENRSSGIPTIRREMQLAGLPEPLFENARGVFRVTLFAQRKSTTNKVFTGHIGGNVQTPAETLQEQILQFCKQPQSRDALAQRFSYLTKTFLFTRYVNPLVEQGALALGLPDKPRSKKQTYTTTIQSLTNTAVSLSMM